MGKVFTIHAGKHYSNGLHLSALVGNTLLQFKALFQADCIYDPEREPEQISKLYGMSYGLHHRASARFGWRSDGTQIEVLTYVYVGPSQRVSDHLAWISPDSWHSFTIRRKGKSVQLVMDRLPAREYLLAAPWPIGYRLFPYFGGAIGAPHTMHIEIELHGMNGVGF